jgi:poly(3-hydroxybutyrate) depolymerase
VRAANPLRRPGQIEMRARLGTLALVLLAMAVALEGAIVGSAVAQARADLLLNLNQSEQGRLPSEDLLQLFTREEARVAAPHGPEGTVPYYLYKPARLDPVAKHPLIVWLPGRGLVESQYESMGFMNWVDSFLSAGDARLDQHQFFLLVPGGSRFAVEYGSREEGSGESPVELHPDKFALAIAMLEDAIAKYAIDEQRVSVTGISNGGAAAWELAMRYPERFAAVAPLASPGGDASRAALLKDVPVWAFHNQQDAEVSIAGDRTMVAAINQAGGRAFLTELDRGGHNAWIPAMKEHDVRSWLLAQRRGQEVFVPHGHRSWWERVAAGVWPSGTHDPSSSTGRLAGWKPAAAAAAFGAGLLVIAYYRRRQRSNRTESAAVDA